MNSQKCSPSNAADQLHGSRIRKLLLARVSIFRRTDSLSFGAPMCAMIGDSSSCV